MGRESLKSLFSNGSKPDESNFESLIDSFVNRLDDGFSKTKEDGLIVVPDQETSDKLISFYKLIDDDNPEWSMSLDINDKGKGLNFVEVGANGVDDSRLYLKKGGNIGISTKEPKTKLDVNGILGTKSRVGTYKIDSIPADGVWHDVLTGLNGCHAFEIMAYVGKEKSGKYALMHANALSTFGKSRNKIRKTQAHFGWWWNKISIRWTGSTFDYGLQMKTRTDYGKNQNIKFCISTLWDNDIMSLFSDEDE